MWESLDQRVSGGIYELDLSTEARRLYRVWPRAQSWHRVGAGQALLTKTLALGAAVASVAEIDGGVGSLDRKRFRRHHQIQGLSGAAARQGVRPLRHGARRHRRR